MTDETTDQADDGARVETTTEQMLERAAIAQRTLVNNLRGARSAHDDHVRDERERLAALWKRQRADLNRRIAEALDEAERLERALRSYRKGRGGDS